MTDTTTRKSFEYNAKGIQLSKSKDTIKYEEMWKLWFKIEKDGTVLLMISDSASSNII